MAQSNAKSARAKPVKPYEDFPLFPHASGRWAKKIRGQLEYFGSWDDGWQQALDNYQAWKDDLYAGRRPAKSDLGRLTIRGLCNAFRESKETKLATGELVQQTLDDYLESINRIIHVFGKTVAVGQELSAEPGVSQINGGCGRLPQRTGIPGFTTHI
jgi:hypothetical protein